MNEFRVENNVKNNSIDNNQKDNCPICYEDIGDFDICITKCGHCFHSKCLRRWLVNKCQTPECPCCRASLVDTETSEKSENSM